MKGDFSRRTFDPRKHYSAVQMQQGRVQLDSDSNEQSDILAHRIETEALDVIGDSGAPLQEAGFHIVLDPTELTTDEQGIPGNKPVPALATSPAATDFYISAGRYYVDGILCENESIITYRSQKDLPDPALMTKTTVAYLVYLDAWRRHLTTLDDPLIRETALGGPDTATRIKTLWQVKWFEVPKNTSCAAAFDLLQKDFTKDPKGNLTARGQVAGTSSDPCIIPPTAGFRGLENQLYRVEVHNPGAAYDVNAGANVSNITDLPVGAMNKVKVTTGTWNASDFVEIFRDNDPMGGTLAQVVSASGAANNRTLTLNRDLPGLSLTDQPKLRLVTSTFKWSRDNGSVVTSIEKIDTSLNQITVHDVGPDNVLGFATGQWVEITDDGFELNAKPAQLAQIVDVKPETRVITLKGPITALDPSNATTGVNKDRVPKLRRWDGIAAIKRNPKPPAEDWVNLEDGVQVRFSAGNYVTGDYWQIPARTATADADSGTIEWPLDNQNPKQPIPLPPAGITHHYSALAILDRTASKLTVTTDCRCIFSPLTHLSAFFYVGGDGQEAMPGDPMPKPLEVGVFDVGVSRACTPVAGLKVLFKALDPGGRVAANSGGLGAATDTVTITTDADGIARCAWQLVGTAGAPATWTPTTQQVEARLLDDKNSPLPPVIRFTGNLSIAGQVAYDPGACGSLTGDTTVQKALTKLSGLTSLAYVSGSGQEVMPGEALQPLVVLPVSPCGIVTGATVTFTAKPGNGTVSVPVTQPDGSITCNWTLDAATPNQVVDATLVSATGRTIIAPTTVRFTANLSLASHVAYNPSKCSKLPASTATVQDALDGLCALLDAKEPGVHVTDVHVGAPGEATQPLHIDSMVPADVVARGFQVTCDRPLDPKTISHATCYLVVQVPFFLRRPEAPMATLFTIIELSLGFAGYHQVVIAGKVGVKENVITWSPDRAGPLFLRDEVSALMHTAKLDRTLATLILKGNFIQDKERKALLDGDLFVPKDLPSGDDRRGGDFEMWFWITPFTVLASLTVLKSLIKVGEETQGTVTLTGPAPADQANGITVNLSFEVTPGTAAANVTIPPTVVIPPGASTATFTIKGVSPGQLSLTATLGEVVLRTPMAISG